MNKKLIALAILFAMGSAHACENTEDCKAAVDDVYEAINTKMQPKQENESAAVWGEKYANWLGRVNEVAERRLGTTFDNLGDIARWEIANSKTGSSANADSGENGNTGATDTNTKNPTGDFIEPELETAYVTAGQAQAGDRAAIAQAQDYADSVATEVENKTKDYN